VKNYSSEKEICMDTNDWSATRKFFVQLPVYFGCYTSSEDRTHKNSLPAELMIRPNNWEWCKKCCRKSPIPILIGYFLALNGPSHVTVLRGPGQEKICAYF
jgi:hypothetical protein